MLLHWAHAALSKAAIERAEAYRPHIEWAFRQPGVTSSTIETFNHSISDGRALDGAAIAEDGASSRAASAASPPPQEVARPRVHAMWKHSPELTGKQVLASLGREDLMGVRRARELLRECRMASAKRSRTQKLLGWRIDNWTAARLRLGAILEAAPGTHCRAGSQETKAPTRGVTLVGSENYEPVLADWRQA
jgi:hypothetical protein